jgi:hypothetical protein
MAIYDSKTILGASKGIFDIGGVKYSTQIDTSNHTNNVTLNGPDGRPVMYYNTSNKTWTQSNQNTPQAVIDAVKTGNQLATDITNTTAQTTYLGQGGNAGGGWAQVELTTGGIKKPGTGTTPTVTAPSQGLNPNDPGNNPANNPNNQPILGDNIESMVGEFGQDDYTKVQKFLYYPLDINDSKQDKVVISQFQYVVGDIKNAITGSLLNRESQLSQQKQLTGTVVLPITNNLTETNATGWGESRLSSIAAGLMGAGAQFAGDVGSGNLINATTGAFNRIGEIIKDEGVSTRAKQYFTSRFSASLIQKLGIQIDPEAYITRATGAVINPNLELLFNGPTLRSFGLAFKMSPRSEKEAKNIRTIIKFFKKGMAPRKAKDGNGVFLGTPHIFNISFRSGSGEQIASIGEFKTCALVRCEVNYTPDGFYAAYQDSLVSGGSQPIALTLQLGFAELTPIFSDEYDLTLDSVGPDLKLAPTNIGK